MRQFLQAWLAALTLIIVAPSAFAQAPFPSRPVKIILPYAAGGGGDQFTRMFAQALSDRWKQPVVIENRPGAGATIGTDVVAKAKPDGYTLLMISSTIAVTPSAYSNLPYDVFKDLTPIGLLARSPFIVAVNSALPIHNFADFLRYGKENPGKLNFGHGGNGTMAHLTYELLKSRTGFEATAIAYKGSNPAMVAALAGQIDFIIDTPAAIGQYVKAGKLRPIAATTAKRAAAMPDVPTISESGVPGFETSVWFALMGPGGLPSALAHQINADALSAFKAAGLASKIALLGMEPFMSSPEEFDALLHNEVAKWGKVVKNAGIKFN